MQISFGKKIPITTCNIYNKEAQQYERATLYEIDCNDEADIDYLLRPDGMWEFKESIAYDAKNKYLDIKYCMCPNDIMNRYYSLGTKNGKVACLCETQSVYGNTNIRYIESNPDKHYKFAGQTMLASIAKLIYSTSQCLEINIPTAWARPFYSKVCGFKEDLTGFGYELRQKDMKKFISRTEQRTKGEILSSKG